MFLSAQSCAKHKIHINHLGKLLFYGDLIPTEAQMHETNTRHHTLFLLTWTPAHFFFIPWHKEEGPKKDMGHHRIFFFLLWTGLTFPPQQCHCGQVKFSISTAAAVNNSSYLSSASYCADCATCSLVYSSKWYYEERMAALFILQKEIQRLKGVMWPSQGKGPSTRSRVGAWAQKVWPLVSVKHNMMKLNSYLVGTQHEA